MSEMITHSLERSSPLGGPFIGYCTLCWAQGLPSSSALEPCPNPRGVSSDGALLAAIRGDSADMPDLEPKP